MLPPRVVLNAVYAMLIDGMSAEQREEFDTALHGWDEKNRRADQALFDARGGED